MRTPRPVMGRPQLYPDGKQVSVLVPKEDYRALAEVVELRASQRTSYCLGDLLRGYISKGLDEDAPERERAQGLDPRESQIRQLNAISRSAKRLIQEIRKA